MGFPSTPSNGQTAVVNGITYTYNSARTAWVRSAATTFNLYTASNIAPTTPSLGDHWYYIASDILFEYMSDGTTSYWVDIQSLGQVGNISNMSDTTLSGNVVVGLNNVYSLGAQTGYIKNIYANTIIGNTMSGNSLTISAGNIVAAATTPSTSNTTGALVVVGGMGVGGNITVGGNLSINSNTSTSNISVTNNASISGIASITGNTNISGNLTIAGNVTSNLVITGVTQHFNYITVYSIFEQANITAVAPTGPISIDAITAPVVYFTSNAAANVTINIRGNSTTSLNSILGIGQSATVAIVWQNPATPYYPSAIQVDGSSITPAWQGASAPTKGNANSTDIYSYTIFKKSNAVFTILASQTQYSWSG